MSDGVWLEKLSIRKQNDKYVADLTGYVFLDDGHEENLTLNEFVSNLKQDPAIKSIFADVELGVSDRKEIRGFGVTAFSVQFDNL